MPPSQPRPDGSWNSSACRKAYGSPKPRARPRRNDVGCASGWRWRTSSSSTCPRWTISPSCIPGFARPTCRVRPKENHSVWRREAGRFTLIVAPGVLDERRRDVPRRVGPHEASDLYVGVPFGPKARLILIYLQTEGRKSRRGQHGRLDVGLDPLAGPGRDRRSEGYDQRGAGSR